MQKRVDEVFSDPEKLAQLDKIMNERKIRFPKIGSNGKEVGYVEFTPNEIFAKCLKESDYNSSSILYHGTTKEAKDSILKNGFDLKYFKRGESGKGVYLAVSEDGAAQYAAANGGEIIKVKLADGLKIGKLKDPDGIYCGARGLISEIKNDYYLRSDIADNLGINILSDEPSKIVEEYILKKANKMGFGGLELSTANASCRYVVIPDPKNIKILS